MAQKIRVLRVPVLENGPRYTAMKVASLLRRRDPLNSSLWVRCCEGGLRCGEVIRCGEESLRRCVPVALLLSAFFSFLLLFYFFVFSYPFDSNIAIFYRTI